MANSPSALRSQYGDLYGSSMLPVLEELFRMETAQQAGIREQIYKVVSTDRDIYQASEIHDMPLFNQMSEGEEFSFERPKQGANKTFSIVKYGLGFSISEEAVEDGKFDMIADAVRKLGRSGRESQEINAMNVFNNGFASETTADGQPVFDTAHTLPSGLTFRNELSASADLSDSSLRTALVDFETQFIGNSGIFLDLKPRVLLVHPTEKRTAMELIGSELKNNDVSSDNGPTNAMNTHKGEGLRVATSSRLTDTDAWFLLAESSETGLRVIIRKPLETKVAGPDQGFTTDSIFYKARYREQIGVTHPYGIYGSPGA